MFGRPAALPGAAASAHLWVAVAVAAVPVSVLCVTVIVLVLTVQRGERIAAIKALPPLVAAIRGRSYGRATSRSGRRAVPAKADLHGNGDEPGRE